MVKSDMDARQRVSSPAVGVPVGSGPMLTYSYCDTRAVPLTESLERQIDESEVKHDFLLVEYTFVRLCVCSMITTRW